MRHTNQTVSLRDLVKKMKHHSTRTILLTAIITLLLSAGLIYLMFPTQDVKAEEEKPVSTAVIPQQTDMADQLKEIMTYLKKLDVQVNTNQKGLEEIRKIQEDTEKNGEKTAEQKAAEREISELGTSMTTLQDQITQTGTQITALQSLLESGQKENQDKLNQKFTEITDALMKISQNYSDTQTKTEMLIKDMEGSSDARHEETLRQLKEMQTGLESVDTRNLTDMTARLKEMESSWQKQMADLAGEVNGNITDLNQKISSQMEDMNMTISNQYSELLRQSGGKDDEILGRISEMNQTVNSRMDQVFQRVSDGKQLLASALLTKGVNINKDATFIQFAEAIRNTPQQLVIGVEKLPGTVSYEYHHHTDKDGKLKGSEQVGANEKGGCYTVPVYHVHMGDPYHGGGCYSIPRYHQHSGSCYASVSYDTSTDHVLYDLDRENGELFHMYRCDVCGSEFKSTNGGHKHYETHLVCGRNGGTVEGYVTGCGMTTDTVTGYRPGCGLSEGQIVAAYIVYEGGSDKDTSQMQELRTSQMYTDKTCPGQAWRKVKQ